MIGRLHHVVLDCADPAALGEIYSALLGQPVTHSSPDWVVVSVDETTSGLACQLAPDHQPPEWGDPSRPQQVHLDVTVDDLEAAHPLVVALGARALTPEGGAFRVYADPAGHPFCLITRPSWAPPVSSTEAFLTPATP